MRHCQKKLKIYAAIWGKPSNGVSVKNKMDYIASAET
jgi:hypothetical protein